jgi:hypothetical protein
MCSFNQISNKVSGVVYEGWNPDAKKFNEIKIPTEHIYLFHQWWKATSIKIDSLFLKDKNIKPFLSTTPNYTQLLLYALFTLE